MNKSILIVSEDKSKLENAVNCLGIKMLIHINNINKAEQIHKEITDKFNSKIVFTYLGPFNSLPLTASFENKFQIIKIID